MRSRLIRNSFAAVVAGFALGVSLDAMAELKVIELAVETRADAAVLPTGPASALVVTPCKGCAPLSLPSTTGSRYFVGREQVSLEELKRWLAGRPTTLLLILYRKDSRELTRVVATAS